MNIQTVIANLLKTIKDKEQALAEFEAATLGRETNTLATYAAKEFLRINIKELNAILADCMKVREADIVADLERKEKDIEQSWRDNPDRSGGQFTDDEINNTGWQ